MQETRRDGRRGNRQVKPRRQWYPVWGLEEPRREWNGWSVYRHGTQSILDRYLITPKRVPVLDYGVTVLDVLAAIGVAAFMLLMAQLVGIGIDGWLDTAGY